MRRPGMVIIVVLLFGAAGCGSADPPTKAAGDKPPITLMAVTPGLAGFPGDEQLAQFARQVADLSGGSIIIDTTAAVEGLGRDQKAVEMVRQGEFPEGSKVLYAHLGGVPALNAYSFLFRNG